MGRFHRHADGTGHDHDGDLAAFHANLRAVNPAAATLEISARTGAGVDAWCAWLTGTG